MESKIRVLIADDHPLLREALRSTFDQHQDIQVVAEAADGEEAVRMAAELKPDVAVMDIVMPKVSGIEATRQIRQASPKTAVLILSAYDDDRYVIGLLEAGAAGYLLKSARGQALAEAVRTVYAGESVLHPAIIAKMLRYSAHADGATATRKSEEALSDREMEVLKLAASGLSNKDIAAELALSPRTIKAHLSNIFDKMKVASRTEAIVKGVRQGWLSLESVPQNGSAG